jgi:hypothetical protein
VLCFSAETRALGCVLVFGLFGFVFCSFKVAICLLVFRLVCGQRFCCIPVGIVFQAYWSVVLFVPVFFFFFFFFFFFNFFFHLKKKKKKKTLCYSSPSTL